jgi:serine-type D-Ala-D-Ala carboxypeptidase/endopeptidase (penicillin-binding protein 4)
LLLNPYLNLCHIYFMTLQTINLLQKRSIIIAGKILNTAIFSLLMGSLTARADTAIVPPPAAAQASVLPSTLLGTLPMTLPPNVAEVFVRAGVPLANVAVFMQEAGGAKPPILALNTGKAMNPASVMKLVTTYAALDMLGPAYSFRTDVLVLGEVSNGVLRGDLAFKGYGDPKLTVERFWLLLRQLRERGLQEIRGDIVLDKSFFDVPPHDPAKFDGEALRAYNVGPDALMLNFKAVRFGFAANVDQKSVSIAPDIRPAQLEIGNQVKLTEGNCGEWKDRVKIDVQYPSSNTTTQVKVNFTGSYPKSCGEKIWNVSLLDHNRFFGGSFAKMWTDLGGVWKGAVKAQSVPATARLIAQSESPPLSDIVRDINKYSNNVMARQVFLTLSGTPIVDVALVQAMGETTVATSAEPALRGEAGRSEKLIKEWLNLKGIAAPELVMENGSGLSRIERINAATLGNILQTAYKSSVMPEFLSSMPLLGVDGTMRKRSRAEGVAGQAHIKGGTLSDVRAIAGYVLDKSGKRWVVVLMVNDANAAATQRAQDLLLAWVYGR